MGGEGARERGGEGGGARGRRGQGEQCEGEDEDNDGSMIEGQDGGRKEWVVGDRVRMLDRVRRGDLGS